ncbi:MAG TPA: alpha/beta hydrolase [Ideonella sp.]|jgi:pimeloyl-ACP methyl ester carboxylesterase|nr:alpha/beta hydrolase [Ideonella sp.]
MTSAEFVDIDWAGRPIRIEHAWFGRERAGQPLMVFLHEGLGSLSMWKDFPQQLTDALGWRGLVYSRPGYGGSTQRAPDEAWAPDFMHRQAQEVLPAMLHALGVDEPVWLFGHSDGASIALLHAAAFPEYVAGAIVLAPHIFVENLSVTSIAKAREAYLQTDLRERLARYHDDPDSAFWGWNDIWLAPAFRDWSIEPELDAIRCPLLAVQGLDDEYGTLAQVHGIAQRVPGAELLELSDCGHSPHRDQPARVIEAVQSFTRRQRCVAQPSG